MFYPAVLSDKGKRTVYDAGLFGLLGENDDEVSLIWFLQPSKSFFSFLVFVYAYPFPWSGANWERDVEQGFGDFMQEMVCLMQRERTQVLLFSFLFYSVAFLDEELLIEV